MAESGLAEITVAAGILWRDGRFLACQRPEGKPLAGFWEFPGGKSELLETPEQALKRELAEELGIEVGETRFFAARQHVYAERGLIAKLFFYEVLEFVGEPRPLENQKLAWIEPESAHSLPFLPADAEIIGKIAVMGHDR